MLKLISYCWNWFFSQALSYVYPPNESYINTNASVLTHNHHLAKLRMKTEHSENKCIAVSGKPCDNRLTTLCQLNYPSMYNNKPIRENDYDDMNLKVINWNIHNGFNSVYKHTFMDQCEYLASVDADVICLQEVDNTVHNISSVSDISGTSGMSIVEDNHQVNGINQAIFIARYCNYPYYVQYHNMAILSRFPIIHSHHIVDNTWAVGYGSHALVADILLDPSDIHDNSRTVSIYNCHLNNDLVGYEQWHFVKNTSLTYELLALSYNRLPLIICGDFNSLSWYSGLKTIRDTLCYKPEHEIWTRNRPTYPVMYPVLKLDRIYTNQNTYYECVIKFVSNYVDYRCKLSDHHPLVTFFEIL